MTPQRDTNLNTILKTTIHTYVTKIDLEYFKANTRYDTVLGYLASKVTSFDTGLPDLLSIDLNTTVIFPFVEESKLSISKQSQLESYVLSHANRFLLFTNDRSMFLEPSSRIFYTILNTVMDESMNYHVTLQRVELLLYY